jgi:putative DNA primase/helicase
MQALKSKTAEEATGRWPGILQQLEIDPAYLRNTQGPCHLRRQKPLPL